MVRKVLYLIAMLKIQQLRLVVMVGKLSVRLKNHKCPAVQQLLLLFLQLMIVLIQVLEITSETKLSVVCSNC